MRDIQADTVVAEFKTDQNKLSVWKVESQTDIEDAFIALGSNCSNIGTIWAAKISPEDLPEAEFENEEGDTPTIGINHKHYNITRLNYVTLGDVISSVLGCLRSQDSRIVVKSRSEMKRILAKAYTQSRLDVKGLNSSVLQDIKKEIERHPIID